MDKPTGPVEQEAESVNAAQNPAVPSSEPERVHFEMTPLSECYRGHLPELGLFAVFYDGETRPVAAFVLEQDAREYAKQYSGGESSWELRHVSVVPFGRTGDDERQRILAHLRQFSDKDVGDTSWSLLDGLIADIEQGVHQREGGSVSKGEQQSGFTYREALEGMVAAFDGRPAGEPFEIGEITRQSALNIAIRTLGWERPNLTTHPENDRQTTTEGATVPSRPLPNSDVFYEAGYAHGRAACIAKVWEMGDECRSRGDRTPAEHRDTQLAWLWKSDIATEIITALESLSPTTPDVQGKQK